ncbi:MAG: DNA-processing protein DprA [Candidatus Spechtbacterales bacterium]|nr:DNA-processing protein DprA [Candidatus Spechtbacterales bacterium]
MDIKKLKITDEKYPKILKEINDPPELLYYRGNLDALDYPAGIAVVGTRRCSEYGKQAAEKITAGLSKNNITVISGLARGIDAYAHKATLENKFSAIAVLGTPVDDKSISPKTNKRLAQNIIESGGIIMSEYESGSRVYPSNFIKRNRIIAGLSLGVLVIEAPLKSGARSTARFAVDYNRDVYAVPGSIFSRLSEGCNDLIKQGAKCITSAEDILEELNLNYELKLDKPSGNAVQLEGEEKRIYDFIAESQEAIHIDTIIEETKLDPSDVAEIVTKLILEDIIEEPKANHYIASM